MSDQLNQITALVLAGSRAGGDPLAVYAGVSHKALIEIDGRTMIEHVVAALAANTRVARIVICIDRPEILEPLPGLREASRCKPITTIHSGPGPSASIGAAMESEGTPLLVVTGDHPLLQSAWIDTFLANCPAQADTVVALARKAAVCNAAPDTKRTWLEFSDGAFSGCNMFLMRSPAARGVVDLWHQLEAGRKRPLKMLMHLGIGYALRYRLGCLRLDSALLRLSTLTGARINWVELADGRAAIDVDKPDDLILVRRLMTGAAC